MSLVELKRILYPEPIVATGVTSTVINSTSIKLAHMLNVPKSGNISHIVFRTVAVTTPATIQVRIETLSSIGEPTGTLIHANATASQASPAANTNYELALAAPVAVTKNTKIAIVYDCPVGSPNLALARLATPFGSIASQPYTLNYNGSAWTKQSSVGVCALKYDDGSYPYLEGVYPPMTMAATSFNTSTVAFDEAGNLFTLPIECQVNGFWVFMSNATGGFDNVLYDASDNVLASVSDTSQIGIVSGGTVRINRLNTPIILQPNTQYRQTVKATDAVNSATRYMTFDSAAIQEVIPGGDTFTYTQRKGSGAWSQTTNRRVLMGLLIDQVNDLGSTGKFKIMTSGGLVDVS